MASITSEANGRRTIQFIGKDGKRRSIRLGKTPMRIAETVKVRVEHLVAAAFGSGAIDPETARWLTTIDKRLSDKLAKAGLAPKREQLTLGEFLDAYLASRTDIKHWTKTNCEQARKNLVAYFGAGRDMATITPGEADEFRRHLLTRLAENTVRRHCGRAKQFFRAAVRRKLIVDNPFADMKDCGVKANRERDYFVTRQEADKVLAACPDVEWQLIFALARYGGLRTPSELLGLRWGDVDWDRGRMTVRSPKTEHHAGKESRVVPLFPELRPYLESAWDAAAEGAEFIITRYRDKGVNLRTHLERIIERAGLTPWPKLFHNLRASRATELAAEYPAHVAAEWLGHSRLVAQEHYWRVTDADFERAASVPTEALAKSTVQRAAKSGAVNAETALQNAVQHPAASDGTPSQETKKALTNQGLSQVVANSCDNLPIVQMPRVGLEPTTY